LLATDAAPAEANAASPAPIGGANPSNGLDNGAPRLRIERADGVTAFDPRDISLDDLRNFIEGN
jgi:hypothetical protein